MDEPIHDPIPVEEPEVIAEADALTRELLPRLTDEQAEPLARAILSGYTDALNDRQEWESRAADAERQYHGLLEEKDFPWPGASNFHVPLTALAVESLKPRLIESVLGGDPFLFVRGMSAADQAREETTELFLNWQLLTELDIAPLVEQSAHLFQLPGTVVAKLFWRTEERIHRAVRKFETTVPMKEMFRAIFGDAEPEGLKPTGPMSFRGSLRTHDHRLLPVTLKVKTLPDEIQVLVERTETTYEGPRVDLIPPEDFIAPVKGGTDVQGLPWCIHRQWLSEDALRRKARLGRLDADAVEKLIATQHPAGDEVQSDAADLRETRDQVEGVEGFGSSNVRADEYEVLETYLRWDLDEDGLEEELIVWVCPQLPDTVLGWDYLENVYAHGKRPFEVGRFITIPFRFYGMSLPQFIRAIQEEINTVHNQRVDAGTIQNTPFYFYRASSTHAPTAHRVRPGEGIPVDNPASDILMPRWAITPAWGQQEEAVLYQYFERLTGLTDLALGRQPTRVGATRTATGVSALLSESGLRFKVIMQSFQRFWTGIFEQILALDQQYLPPGKEFRVTGRWPELIRLTDKGDIQGRYDLRLSITTEVMNKQVLREDSALRLQAIMNPAVFQAGLVTPRGLYKAYRDFLKAHGETNPESVLEYPREVIVRTPEEELDLILAGEPVEPTPLENLGRHIQVHYEQLSQGAVRQVLGPERVRTLEEHLAQTIQLAQAQAMAQAMGGGAPQVGQQAVNAEIGRQAPQQQEPEPTAMGGMNGGGGGQPGRVPAGAA